MWAAPHEFPLPRRLWLTLPRVQAAIGVPLAMLVAPDSEPLIGTSGHNSSVVEVKLAYYPDDGGHATELMTCRPLFGESFEQVFSNVFGNYQLSCCGHTGVPWDPGRPPDSAMDTLDRPPNEDARYSVTIDGVATRWRGLEAQHIMTGEPLAACGGVVGESIIMACGPPAALDGLAITLWGGERP